MLFQGEIRSSSLKTHDTIDAAIDAFKKKFQDKTLNDWDKRANFEAVPGKYTLLEMDEDEEEEEDTKEKVRIVVTCKR